MTRSGSLKRRSILRKCFSLAVRAGLFCTLIILADDRKLRVDVEVATVEVSVFDRQGHPVHGLKREDFRLFEEGKERPILAVEEVKPAAPESLTSQGGQRESSDRQGKTVLLLFDDSTLSPSHVTITRDLAAGFVQQNMRSGDLFGVASHALNLKLIQPFTRDVQEVLRAIQEPGMSYSRNLGAAPTPRDLQRDSITGPRFRSPRMVDPSEQEMQESRVRGLSLLETLKDLCSSLAKIKGRKTLLVFTEDLNVPTDLQGQLQEATAAAQMANVVMYSVDVRSVSVAPSKRSF